MYMRMVNGGVHFIYFADQFLLRKLLDNFLELQKTLLRKNKETAADCY